MTVAAATFLATAMQPKAAGAQPVAGDNASREFATVLESVSGETTATDAAAAMMMPAQPTHITQPLPTQLPTSLVASTRPGAEGEGIDPAGAVGDASTTLPPPALAGEGAVTGEGANGAGDQSVAEATAAVVPENADLIAQQSTTLPTGAETTATTSVPATTAAAAAAAVVGTPSPAPAGRPSSTAANSAQGTTVSASSAPTHIGATGTDVSASLLTDAPQQSPDLIATDQPAASQGDAQPSASTQSAATAQVANPAALQGAVAGPAQPADATAAAADAFAPAHAPQANAVDIAAATTAPASDTVKASATPPALQSAPAATVQVYARIIERADGKAQRFEVRLDPAELGRVDVRIEIGADKKVHAVLAAHDSAALNDLMRGQRALERALSDAGIDLADKGVRFEMATDNGRSGAHQQREGEAGRQQANVWRNFETLDVPVGEDAAGAAVRPSWQPQRLDLVA